MVSDKDWNLEPLLGGSVEKLKGCQTSLHTEFCQLLIQAATLALLFTLTGAWRSHTAFHRNQLSGPVGECLPESGTV